MTGETPKVSNVSPEAEWMQRIPSVSRRKNIQKPTTHWKADSMSSFASLTRVLHTGVFEVRPDARNQHFGQGTCGSKLNRRGYAILVHVSTYQGSILVPVFCAHSHMITALRRTTEKTCHPSSSGLHNGRRHAESPHRPVECICRHFRFSHFVNSTTSRHTGMSLGAPY